MSEVKQEGDFKIKSKKKTPKKVELNNQPISKVDLSKKPDPDPDPNPDPKPQPDPGPQPDPEVVDGEIIEIQDPEPEPDPQPDPEPTPDPELNVELPENIEKLISFMEETGGTMEDYVRLNADYSNVDEKTLLKEYYKQTKPYLESDDVSLILEDYDYDEELDEEKDIRKKKLAFKEEVAKAKSFLEQTKSKYYDEIKLRPGVTQEQQKATDFFNRYNEDQKVAKEQHEDFVSKTNNYFNENFKGFDFSVKDKKFRYGVTNPTKLAEEQSNINNFIGKFLDKNGKVSDPSGYHKAIFMANNSDKILNHVYEQGRTDATKEIVNKSKNPTVGARQPAPTQFINGLKVKSISQPQSSKLKIKNNKF